MKNLMVVLAAISILMIAPVMAQENELGNPGITPDSGLYFLDRMFDGFQSAESRANEKAAEALAMAREANAGAAQVALQHYESAMERKQNQAQGDEDEAEEVAVQATNHLIVLANVLEQVPDEAKSAIQLAMQVSVRGRDEAVDALTEINPSRGQQVARDTLTRVMTETPAQAQAGLLEAFNSVGSPDAGSVSQGQIPQQGTAGQGVQVTPSQ